MTISEIFDQAKALSARERKELAKLLIDTLDVPEQPEVVEQRTEHWGRTLVQLINSLDMSDWESMDINDPVEWVKALRQEDEERLKAYWEGKP